MKKYILSKYFSNKEIINNFIWRSLQSIGKQAVTFIIVILCAKLLSPYDFGIYNYILAIVFLLIMFCDFGISSATSKYVAEFNSTDKIKLKYILFNSLILIIGFGSIIIFLIMLFGKYIFFDNYLFILYTIPLLFLIPISSLYDGIFRGLKKFKTLAWITLAVGGISIIIVYLIVTTFGLIGALISQSVFYTLLVLVLSIVNGKFEFKFDKTLMRQILNYSLIIGISSIGYFLYSRVDILILAQFGYIQEIGFYEIINRGFEFMFLPFVLLAQVISPNITAIFSNHKYTLVRNKLRFFMKLIIPLAILMAILFYLLFPMFIQTFLPAYYISEMIIIITILTFLIPSKIWGVFQTQSFIVATGYAKIIAITTLICGFLNVILDIIFIELIGFTGVFLTTLLIHTANIVFQTYYYNLKMKELK